MKKTIGIVMVLLMLMSVTVALAGVNKDAQPDKTDDDLGLQIFEKELSTTARDEYVPDEFIVKFKPEVGKKKIGEINLGHETSIKRAGSHFMQLNVPKGKTVDEMVGAYSRNPNVEYAEPNHIARTCMVPNDPLYSYQWHLDIPEDDEIPEWHGENGGGINVEPAWDISTGTGVIVAVIDTGVAYEDYEEFVDGPGRRDYWITYKRAPDLAGTNFVAGYDFVNTDIHPNDDEGHGTHVTGTIAQSTNNGIGAAGVAFNCSIMPVKVLDSSGSGTYDWIADGIYYAADHDAQVISMSLGGTAASTTLENALAYAYGKGVTIICAAGNDGAGAAPSYPAAYDAYCIAVGATRYDEEVSYYSTTGDYVDIAAPGGDLRVDQNGDGYGDGVLQQTHDGSDYTNFGYWFYQGTSMAAPHVSGVAALLISNGVTDPDDVREALESTAEDKGDTGRDPECGWGIVDAYAALNYSAVLNEPPVADASGSYSGTEDIAIAFDGSGSCDSDGDPLTYAWDFGDGSTEIGVNPTHAYAAGGTYTVTLVVNDGKVDSEPNTTTADITEVNDPPVADAGPNQTTLVNEDVTFNGSGSYDIDGTITTYEWEFGDGTTGTGMTTTHAYGAAGTYTANLTVTDDDELKDTDTVVVTVTEEPAYTMHIGSIVMSTDSKTRGRNTFVWAVATVTILDESDSPVEGATVSGLWSGATDDSDSGLTGTSGEVVLNSDAVRNAPSETTFAFTVDGVLLTGWTYDSAANIETSDSIP
jgi:serine protease